MAKLHLLLSLSLVLPLLWPAQGVAAQGRGRAEVHLSGSAGEESEAGPESADEGAGDREEAEGDSSATVRLSADAEAESAPQISAPPVGDGSGGSTSEALPGGPFDPESYVALSADTRAQLSLGGFRLYLERTRSDDESLYQALNTPLTSLEEQESAADAIFWTSFGLSLGAGVGAAVSYGLEEEELGAGLLIGGLSTFLLGVVIQAIVRPGRADLMGLIDLLDARIGRR